MTFIAPYFIQKLIEFRGRLFIKNFLNRFGPLETFTEQVLLKKIRRNEDSDYGRRFNFHLIQSIQDFRERIPLSEYDDFEPYIERVKQGQIQALFGPTEKIHMFALTSGTTGRAKYIPVTTSFFKEYKEGSKLWASATALEFKGRFIRGKVLPIFSPVEEEISPTGLPCGAISGFIVREQGRLVSKLYAVGPEIGDIKNSSERLYAFLRKAAESSVCVMVTANPSTLLQFARVLAEKSEELLSDLENGTFLGRVPSFRLKKMPKRAAELREIRNQKGLLTPKDIWPFLDILACWKGGTLFHYVEELPKVYGNVEIREIGLMASEGRFSLPIVSGTDDGILNIFHHFLEFIPEDAEDLSQPRTLLVHEIEKGKRYFLVITTSAGLYRYKLHDLVEVTDFYRGIPMIRFLNKGRHIASLTGEKVTEHQVVTSLHKRLGSSDPHRLFYRFFPSFEPIPHYRMYVEDGVKLGARDEEFIKGFDAELRRLNMEYDSKRASGRLGMPRVYRVKRGTFAAEAGKSHRPEQFKPVFLSSDPESYKKYASELI